MIELDHERLTVYQGALDFVVVPDQLVISSPVGRSYLVARQDAPFCEG